MPGQIGASMFSPRCARGNRFQSLQRAIIRASLGSSLVFSYAPETPTTLATEHDLHAPSRQQAVVASKSLQRRLRPGADVLNDFSRSQRAELARPGKTEVTHQAVKEACREQIAGASRVDNLVHRKCRNFHHSVRGHRDAAFLTAGHY